MAAMKFIIVLFTISGIFLSGCSATNVESKKNQTQLQARQFQTRSFDTQDVKLVMKALLNVLQDDGFIVKNAVPDLGLISAEKSIDIEDKNTAFLLTFLDKNAKWEKASMIECTANVSDYGKHVRVRVNFQRKIVNNNGGLMKVEQIADDAYYRDFFNKVDKGIFLQKENL